MQTFHEVMVVSGYIGLILLVIAILAFFMFLIIIHYEEKEREDTDGDIDPELIKDDDNQIFMNP